RLTNRGTLANLRHETVQGPQPSGRDTMMILYLLLLLLLVLARVFVAARAKRLESRYARAANTARELLAQPVYKNGNSNRTDATTHAKQQYLLGQVVEKRDRIEARYLAWQARS